MTKIILVKGVSETGKSSAIRKFFQNRTGMHKNRGDITAVIPVKKNKKNYNVGIASGGDTKEIVKENLDFFLKFLVKIDFIVCASRLNGSTISEIIKFSNNNNCQLDQTIITKKLPKNSTQAQIDATAQKVAILIWQKIP